MNDLNEGDVRRLRLFSETKVDLMEVAVEALETHPPEAFVVLAMAPNEEPWSGLSMPPELRARARALERVGTVLVVVAAPVEVLVVLGRMVPAVASAVAVRRAIRFVVCAGRGASVVCVQLDRPWPGPVERRAKN